MKEVILKEFFKGGLDAESLAGDLDDALRISGGRTFLNVDRMEETFTVEPRHLVMVADAFLEGKLDPYHVEAVGFSIVGSDAFEYDTDTIEGERVGESCFDWSAPEVNYPLTDKNMLKFRERLLTGLDSFTKEDTIDN